MNTDISLQGRTDVTEAVIGAAYQVANVLGAGFLEKVYENALVVELRRSRHQVDQQRHAQCLNYLRATQMKTGLVINFGRPRIEVQRVLS